MNLNIVFPNDLFTAKTIQQNDIPCVCQVMLSGNFRVVFSELLFEASGFMSEFDENDINYRFPVLAGGAFAQHCNAMITLKRVNNDKYQVVNLKFFHSLAGWISLIESGEFTPINECEDGDY